MFRIIKKESLNPTVTRMVVEAPLVAKKAQAGQFIILHSRALRLLIMTASRARSPSFSRSSDGRRCC